MTHQFETIIVGAGAAGLGCAKTFSEQNSDFLLIEARDRVGGRVRSLLEPGFQTPIELGAEFIHGIPKPVIELMHQLQITFYDVTDQRRYLHKNKFVGIEKYWDQVQKITRRMNKAKSDSSIYDFLQKQKNLDADLKNIFAGYVEGFYAANLHLMGEKSLADAEDQSGESLNGAQMFRTTDRYDLFLTKIADSLIDHDRLHLRTALKKIDWKPGHVQLTCVQGPSQAEKIYECKKLILAVPLGVLKSSAIEWNQMPKDLEKCFQSVEMGHVQRIVFRFRSRFWEKLTEHPTSFFLCENTNYFPTWWNLQPLRTPHLIAWQGGPKALEMSTWPEEDRVKTALKTLSLWTKKSVSFLNSELETWHTHNWSQDPWARGAYTYIAVHGMSGARRLGRPFDDTIYFIGEATVMGPSRGTVHGAYESGLKLASQLAPIHKGNKARFKS
jgi:monoamine oxidase